MSHAIFDIDVKTDFTANLGKQKNEMLSLIKEQFQKNESEKNINVRIKNIVYKFIHIVQTIKEGIK